LSFSAEYISILLMMTNHLYVKNTHKQSQIIIAIIKVITYVKELLG